MAIRERANRRPVRYEVDFGAPMFVSSVVLHLDIRPERLGPRQYLVAIRGFDGHDEVGLEEGGWSYSERLGAKYYYLPEGPTPSTIKLPSVRIGRAVTSLRVEPQGWVKAPSPANEVFMSIWAVMPASSTGSLLFPVVRRV